MPASSATGLAVILRRRLNYALVSVARKKLELKQGALSSFVSGMILKYNLLLFRAVHLILTFLVFQHFFQAAPRCYLQVPLQNTARMMSSPLNPHLHPTLASASQGAAIAHARL